MKILALVTDAFGGYGGIARYNQDFLRGLAALPEVRKIVAVPRAGVAAAGECPEKIVQVPPDQNRLSYSLRVLWNCIAERIDLIYCGHIYMAPLATLLGRLLNKPVWLAVYGKEVWECPGAWVSWAVERVTMVTAISRDTRRRLLAWANILPQNVRVLPNTINQVFSPGPLPPDLERRYKPTDGKVLLTIARLNRGDRTKGIDRVIKVLPHLVKSFKIVNYVIVGAGDDRAYLEQLAQANGVSAHVHFAGRVTDDELVGYCRLADVFVMPSIQEGFGFVFLEAAAAGTAVIGCDQGGSPDALADGAIGALVDQSRDDALILAVDDALRSPRPPADRVLRFHQDNFRRHLDRLMGQIDARVV